LGNARAAQVTLSWNASPSPSIEKYRVYSSDTSDDYQIGSNFTREVPADVNTVNIEAPYDTTVYLVVTAVDAFGGESRPSNEVAKIANDSSGEVANSDSGGGGGGGGGGGCFLNIISGSQ
jgi:fibronectin type 3 domain-containing protein